MGSTHCRAAPDLLHLRAATLFVLDANGDLITSNEPYEPGRRPAPAFFLSWCRNSYICRFRHDIPHDIRRDITESIAKSWPFVSDQEPDDTDALKPLLADYAPKAKTGGGPAYLFPQDIAGAAGITLVERSNAGVMKNNFADEIPEIDYVQPCYVVLDEAAAVSMCRTVRRLPQAAEAGVETHAAHRGRGYAMKTVAAWATAVMAEDRIPFYSTSWENKASQRVAAKLGLTQCAAEFHIS